MKKWLEKKMKNLEWYDLSLIKLSSVVFGLFLASVIPGILSLSWYWYLIIFIVLALIPGYKAYFN